MDLPSLCTGGTSHNTLTFPDVQATLLITLIGGLAGFVIFSGENISVWLRRLVRYIYSLRDLQRRRQRRSRKIEPLSYGA